MTALRDLTDHDPRGPVTRRVCPYCGHAYRSVRGNQQCCGRPICQRQRIQAYRRKKAALRRAALAQLAPAKPLLCPRGCGNALHYGTLDGHTLEWCVCGYEAVLIPGRSAA